MSTDCDVIIIGSGIGGLTTAALLPRMGADLGAPRIDGGGPRDPASAADHVIAALRAGKHVMAQMRFDGVDIGAMESSNGSAAIGRSRSDQGGCLGQLEPCQHGVAVGLWYARAQQ